MGGANLFGNVEFWKDAYRLKRGEAFIRLTFHRVTPPQEYKASPVEDRQKYESDIRARFEKRLGGSYMDVEKMAAEASKKYVEDIRGAALKYVPLMALGLAMITFLLNFALLNTVSRTMPYDAIQMIRAQTSSDSARKEVEELQSANRDLRRQLDDLRATVQKMLPSATSGAKAPTRESKSK